MLENLLHCSCLYQRLRKVALEAVQLLPACAHITQQHHAFLLEPSQERLGRIEGLRIGGAGSSER